MLTLFSVPKPFEGELGALQRRSVESWRALGVQVLLLGDVAAEAARELDVEHVPGLESTAHGTPRLDSAFALADGAAVSAPLLRQRRRRLRRTCSKPWGCLRSRGAVSARRPDGGGGQAARRRSMDWFVFPAGLFGEVPPFAVGRAGFDNWLVWKARQVGIVVDATHDVRAVHQPHGYEHVTGGMDEAYYGEEAARNLELAGGKGHVYTLHDASHVLRDGKLRRNLGAPLRWRENVRKLAWKAGLR